MIRSVVLFFTVIISSFVCGMYAVLAGVFKVRDGPDSHFAKAPRYWGRSCLWVAGATLVEHNAERKHLPQHIFVANHTGTLDILALGAKLPRPTFVAKAELFKIPVFGAAMLSVGMIPIARANRKSAFASYSVATQRVAAGASVIVYPEGTRGNQYPLRTFKKGPFVLAIQAKASVIPVVIYGTLEVQKKGRFRVRPGVVHMHYLEPISSDGLTYEDRDELAEKTYVAMAACLEREYGVVSPPFDKKP